jgi:hypothetical protein
MVRRPMGHQIYPEREGHYFKDRKCAYLKLEITYSSYLVQMDCYHGKNLSMVIAISQNVEPNPAARSQ